MTHGTEHRCANVREFIDVYGAQLAGRYAFAGNVDDQGRQFRSELSEFLNTPAIIAGIARVRYSISKGFYLLSQRSGHDRILVFWPND
jgi:hypothetical protein